MSTTTEPFIVCNQLTKIYEKGRQQVVPLDAVDLEVSRCEFIALMGPSGSGKTTLLNCIAGIDQPTSGELTVGGQRIGSMSRSELARWRGRRCGYIFQLYHLVPILTAFENVELPLLLDAGLTRGERQKRVDMALDLVGISDRASHFPSELSGGQEQRVAIARAIVTDPDLLVADEPTGDLDRESAEQILGLLRELSRDQGKTIVMVTHDPRAAAQADRCLHLEKGKLLHHPDREAL
jgi:putative ABC transport system ATP-binding protein